MPGPRLTAIVVAILLCPALCWGQLRTALEVRSLSQELAETEMPVDLRGVVVFVDAPGTVFLQDSTAGAFFRLGGETPPRPGDEVRVRGVTATGLYLPGVANSEFEVLGHPGLPEAVPVEFDDLLSGRYHYQRVSVEGIVRLVVPDEENSSLVRLDLGSRVVSVRVESGPGESGKLVGGRVRVSGLAAGELNIRRQLVEPYLRCLDWSEFELVVAPKPPEEVPTVTPGQILTYTVGGSMRQRLRLRGEVLAVFGGGEVFLRSDEVGIGVSLLDSAVRPAVGDSLEVLGFPEMDRFSARLVDAVIVSRQGEGREPLAEAVDFETLLEGSHDSDLVSVEADLSDAYRSADREVLILRQGDRSIRVESPALSEDLAPGARLRVTGISVVESTRRLSNYRTEPERVVLRARDAEDVEVLRSPSWWTSRRLSVALVLFLVATVVAALWIGLLRAQVVRQTAVLRHRIEREAALEERQRLAREFHDALEQQLAGLSLRLDTALARNQDGKLRPDLETSRHLVSLIQTETRNLVSDLRQDPEEAVDLAGSLSELATRLEASTTVPRVTLSLPPEGLEPLPSRTVHHLRMIAQESVTNAVKHASAGTIEIGLACLGDGLRLTVRDDGRGFDTEKETSGQAGHFGCMGMRERCRKIGASIAWSSPAGGGSLVEVTLPRTPKEEKAG